jgi:hypothetical protein
MKFERRTEEKGRDMEIKVEFDAGANRYDVVIDGYYILGIDIPTGTIVRYEGVDESLRLTLDDEGLVKIGETE